MKRLVIAAMVLVLSAGTVHARTKLVALPERESVSIRFDNPAATLVEEERVLTLQEGENLVDFSWKGVRIDPDSIRLTILSHPDEVRLLSVSYPPQEAALVWRMFSEGPWEEKVRISYLLSYIDRLVAYKGVAAKDEKSLDLEAFLILRNFSGEDFDNADITLGQGEPFSGGIAHEETKQLHFMSVKGVPIRKTFTWDAVKLPWEPERMEGSVGVPVHYIIANDEESGLGRNLMWDGKIRVYQDDGHGSTIFLGEGRAGATPVGEEMKIYIGDSRDISVTQQKTLERRVNPRPSRFKVVLYDTDEKIETELENFKDEPVTVDLVQHIPGEWKMAESSMRYEKKDSSTIIFSVEVPAKGKKQVSFRYNRKNVRNREVRQ